MQKEKEKESELLSYYDNLSYEEQRRLITLLNKRGKKAPYYIKFKLTKEGIVSLSKIVKYCEKYSINYTSQKVNAITIRLCFIDLSERNEVIIGSMTL